MCDPSLTETSLCGAYLYVESDVMQLVLFVGIVVTEITVSFSLTTFLEEIGNDRKHTASRY
jgi:hypothetical protein